MRLVWPGALSLPKLLYYINRYLTVVIMVFSNYRQWHEFAGGFEHSLKR
jgi:hypothetical protein